MSKKIWTVHTKYETNGNTVLEEKINGTDTLEINDIH